MNISLKEANKLTQHPAFYRKVKGNLVMFSYHFADPTVYSKNSIARELRGIVFDAETGEIVARPFPKFFNLGERNCSVSESDFIVTNEKIDGSLIFAFVYGSNIVLASKGSFDSDVVVKARQVINSNHKRLIKDLYGRGYTVMFELVDASNPIVVQYPDTELILVGARKNSDGSMMTPKEILCLGKKYGVKCSNIKYQGAAKTIRDKISGLEGVEGVVGYKNPYEICKIKTPWYLRLHKFNPFGLTDKGIKEAFFNQELDDIYPNLSATAKARVDKIVNQITQRIKHKSEKVREFLEKHSDISDRKEFAEILRKEVENAREHWIYFQVKFNGKYIERVVFDYLKKAFCS